MQLQNGTILFIVGSEGLTEMTFGNLNDALKGGIRMQDIKVFTDREEAEHLDCARKRRLLVDDFSEKEMLEATKMTLMDAEDRVIIEVEFSQYRAEPFSINNRPYDMGHFSRFAQQQPEVCTEGPGEVLADNDPDDTGISLISSKRGWQAIWKRYIQQNPEYGNLCR